MCLSRSHAAVQQGGTNAKSPIVAGRAVGPASIGLRDCVLSSRGKAIRRDFSSLQAVTNVLRQAARVDELSDFAVARARLGIDFSIRRISSAKMPEVATWIAM